MSEGTCQYCGQVVQLGHDCSPERANIEATALCNCPDAGRHRIVNEAAKDALEKVNSLFGAGSRAGVNCTAETLMFLREASRLVATEAIGKVSLKLEDYTVSISITNKGRVKISAKKTVAYTEE